MQVLKTSGEVCEIIPSSIYADLTDLSTLTCYSHMVIIIPTWYDYNSIMTKALEIIIMWGDQIIDVRWSQKKEGSVYNPKMISVYIS